MGVSAGLERGVDIDEVAGKRAPVECAHLVRDRIVRMSYRSDGHEDGFVGAPVHAEFDLGNTQATYKWAKFRHPHKPKRWIISRYFGMFNKSRRDRWVFGDRETGAYLLKFAWAKIVRHTMVKGWASPDDPALADYWDWRRGRKQPVLDRARWRALLAQQGRCLLCGGLLLHADCEPQTPDEWEQWAAVTRTAIRKQAITAETGTSAPHDIPTFRLIHTGCRRRLTRDASTRPAPPAKGLQGLPEPGAGKARPPGSEGAAAQ